MFHDDTGDGRDMHVFLFLGVTRHYVERTFSCGQVGTRCVRGQKTSSQSQYQQGLGIPRKGYQRLL